MKKIFVWILLLAFMLLGAACAVETETEIVLSPETILVNGAPISEDAQQAVYLENRIEVHDDVPEELRGLSNRVVTIADAGVYHISGSAEDAQIAVRADDDDSVRIVLDGVSISCRTAPAIAVYSGMDPRTEGEYGVSIELAESSVNSIIGSHTEETEDEETKLSGAVSSLVSLGFEGNGSLNVDADNEGIEVKFGHMTFNGGSYHIEAGDDPINVSEDGVGVLTVNDGYLYSSVKPEQGGEGDGIDSNGRIVFNGGTIINLAHPQSGDSGIDSDLGSSINGGIVVGAGNMYDPIDAASGQLFMMLEFAQPTDELVVVTDAENKPVFAYDFPQSYTYIAFSSPELKEGSYRVYLGGEIKGEQQDGLYTAIDSYIPGTPMQHGGDARSQFGFPGQAPDTPGMRGGRGGKFAGFGMNADLNELLKDTDLNELLAGKDLNGLLTGFNPSDILTEEQMAEAFGGMQPPADMGGFGGPRSMSRSAEQATEIFELSKESTGFTGISQK